MRKYNMIICLLAMALMTGCASRTETIRFGSMPTYSAAIYAVAIEEGFFEEAGVEVELTVFRSARARDGAATAGQLDGFMTDIMGAINLNAKGFPYTMTSREYEDFSLMAGPGVEGEIKDLAKVGISENTVVDYITDTYISSGIDKLSIVALPDRMGALMAGELDYGVFPQPFIGLIKGQGGQALLSTASKDFQPVTVVFDQAFIKASASSVEAFYVGYGKAIEFMQANDYDRYKEHLLTYGLATETTLDAYELPLEAYGLDPVSKADYQAITAWMLDQGLLEVEIPYEALVSLDFVD